MSGSVPSYNLNTDRRVKLLLNGTPVSTSTAASQYARPINLIGTGITATEDTVNDKFDVNLGSTSIANVGTGTGQLYRDTTSGTANFKTIVAGTNISIANNPNDVTISSTITASGVYTPHPISGRKWGWVSGLMPTSGNPGAGFIQGSVWTYTAAGSITQVIDTTNGVYHNWATTSTSGTNATFYGPEYLSRKSDPNFTVKCMVPDISSNRFFIGFSDITPLPNNAFNFLNGGNGFGIRFDTGQDTSTFKLLSNNGASTNTTTSTSFSIANNSLLSINVFGDDANARWGASVNGGSTVFVTTATPAQTAPLAFIINYTTQAASVRNFRMYDIYGECDF